MPSRRNRSHQLTTKNIFRRTDLEKARHGRRAALVAVHARHHPPGLHVRSARVVSDPLSDQEQGLGDRAFPLVEELYHSSVVSRYHCSGEG